MTTTRLHPYPAYKPSGVPWQGDVPIHWQVNAVKQGYQIQLGKMLQPDRETPNDTKVPYLKAIHVQWLSVQTVDPPTMWANPREIVQFGIEKGDLLVCEGGEGGRSGMVRSDIGGYIIQNALHRIRPMGLNLNQYLQFVMYAAAAYRWFDALNAKATIAHFTREKLSAFQIPLPPPPEQRVIVRYLDYVDRRIRHYISAKQKLIALLEEEKQAIVNQAVTRGLDPYVRLKPSGVEWLGNVPDPWEAMRARFLFKEVDVRSTSGRETHLSMSQTLGLVPSHLVEQSLISESYVGGKLCQEGDLVLNRLKAHLGVFALAMQVGVISPDYSVFRKRGSVNMEYYFRVLRLPILRTELRIRAKGIVEGFWRLYTDDFFDIRLPVPPSEEQRAIVQYVDRVSTRVDATIKRARHQIELVEEYRTRLIADAVTGKLDVREAADQLPEETDGMEPTKDNAVANSNAGAGLAVSHEMIQA